MNTPPVVGNSVTSKCIECGAPISPKVKFCPECGASQAKAAPAPIKCVACGAEIPQSAKFCEECGALQTASTASSPEQVGEALPEATVSGADSPISTDSRIPSTTANETSEPTEVGEVSEWSSKQRRHFIIFGIATAVIALACIVWFNIHHIRRLSYQVASPQPQLSVDVQPQGLDADGSSSNPSDVQTQDKTLGSKRLAFLGISLGAEYSSALAMANSFGFISRPCSNPQPIVRCFQRGTDELLELAFNSKKLGRIVSIQYYFPGTLYESVWAALSNKFQNPKGAFEEKKWFSDCWKDKYRKEILEIGMQYGPGEKRSERHGLVTLHPWFPIWDKIETRLTSSPFQYSEPIYGKLNLKPVQNEPNGVGAGAPLANAR